MEAEAERLQRIAAVLVVLVVAALAPARQAHRVRRRRPQTGGQVAVAVLMLVLQVAMEVQELQLSDTYSKRHKGN